MKALYGTDHISVIGGNAKEGINGSQCDYAPVVNYERKWPLDLINYIIFFHLFQIVSD
jgi:hypothetical protein